MEGPSDVVNRFEQTFRRHTRLLIAFMLVGFAAEMALIAVIFLRLPGVPIWIFAPGALVLAAIPALRRMMDRARARFVGFLRSVGPRLVDAGFLGGSGALFVFDNGIVVQPLSGNVSAWLFDSSLESPAAPHTVEEAIRMRRASLGMKTAGVVTQNRGPESVRTQLLELQRRLEVQRPRAFLRERRPVSVRDPRAPTRMSALIVMDPRLFENGNRWMTELDSIRDFLVSLRELSASTYAS